MASRTFVVTVENPAPGRMTGLSDRLLMSGLIGAGALTLTWWTLIACGLWQAIDWVTA